jgi:hypothetical protein
VNEYSFIIGVQFSHKISVLTRIFHAADAFICKAFKGAAVVFYCKPLITQQRNASASALRVKIFQLNKKSSVVKELPASCCY